MFEMQALGTTLFASTLCIAIFVIILIIILIPVWWIYKDAEKRGRSGLGWALFMFLAGLFLNFIGVIIVAVIWLVVRPPIPSPYQPMYPQQQVVVMQQQQQQQYPPQYPPQQPQYQPPPQYQQQPPPPQYQRPPPQQPAQIIPCRYCSAGIPVNSVTCPRCGARLR